jgi:hypothetical protein
MILHAKSLISRNSPKKLKIVSRSGVGPSLAKFVVGWSITPDQATEPID